MKEDNQGTYAILAGRELYNKLKHDEFWGSLIREQEKRNAEEFIEKELRETLVKDLENYIIGIDPVTDSYSVTNPTTSEIKTQPVIKSISDSEFQERGNELYENFFENSFLEEEVKIQPYEVLQKNSKEGYIKELVKEDDIKPYKEQSLSSVKDSSWYDNILKKTEKEYLEQMKKANDLSDYYRYIENDWAVEAQKNKNKKPIYRGCTNRECFCTGKCKEIIGYE